jgi:hypothetical protein
MRALNKLSLGTVTLSLFAAIAMGSYNSMIMGDDTFMADSSGISFTKRLDEIRGEIVIGRMAASSIPWTNFNEKVEKKVVKSKKVIVAVKAKKEVQAVFKTTVMPQPAIMGDMDLELSNVFHKKPLKKGTFSGSAKTVDGVIEEIYVSLPGGKTIEINTRERMAGNVFKYEDPSTREMKSGMFYEVKKGTYMITLTNDSQFPGARLEFQAGASEVAYSDDYYSAQESWEMDKQDKPQDEYSQAQPAQVVIPEDRIDQVEIDNQQRFEQEMREEEFAKNEFDQVPTETEYQF